MACFEGLEQTPLLHLPASPSSRRPGLRRRSIRPSPGLRAQLLLTADPFSRQNAVGAVNPAADRDLLRRRSDQDPTTGYSARQLGDWSDDYPEDAKTFVLTQSACCRKKAAETASNVGRMVGEILADHAISNLRKAQGVLRLADNTIHNG